MQPELMERRILRIEEVMEVTRLARSTIYAMIKSGDFPRPIRVGGRGVRWKLSDIDLWLGSPERAWRSTERR